MRILLPLLLLFLGCSSRPLKYKYNFTHRSLASVLKTEAAPVHRVEVSLRQEKIFASGMDSTFIIAKMFDKEGRVLTNVDEADLTLSTNEDIEAKPFTLKQGIYKAEILPRVMSPDITMRVDWRGQILSQEITLKTTLSPLRDQLVPLHHQYFESKSVGEVNVERGSGSPDTATDGFSFENVGDNAIVDAQKNSHSSRNFSFEYLEQARQNIQFQVDDAPNSTVSHTMHSIFMFFPRKQLPVVEQLMGTLEVTLPNGEKLIFSRDSKEIVEGVFAEGPVDVGPDRFKRHYPDLKYQGQGVVLRVNARGQAPQLGQYETTKIDMEYGIKGSADVLIMNGATGERCRRPKADFWEPLDVMPIEFKFPTDEEFDRYLREKCGFGLFPL